MDQAVKTFSDQTQNPQCKRDWNKTPNGTPLNRNVTKQTAEETDQTHETTYIHWI